MNFLRYALLCFCAFGLHGMDLFRKYDPVKHEVLFGNNMASQHSLLLNVRAGDGGPTTQSLLTAFTVPYKNAVKVVTTQFPLRVKVTRNLSDTGFVQPELAVLIDQQDLAGTKNFVALEEDAGGLLRVQVQ